MAGNCRVGCRPGAMRIVQRDTDVQENFTCVTGRRQGQGGFEVDQQLQRRCEAREMGGRPGRWGHTVIVVACEPDAETDANTGEDEHRGDATRNHSCAGLHEYARGLEWAAGAGARYAWWCGVKRGQAEENTRRRNQ